MEKANFSVFEPFQIGFSYYFKNPKLLFFSQVLFMLVAPFLTAFMVNSIVPDTKSLTTELMLDFLVASAVLYFFFAYLNIAILTYDEGDTNFKTLLPDTDRFTTYLAGYIPLFLLFYIFDDVFLFLANGVANSPIAGLFVGLFGIVLLLAIMVFTVLFLQFYPYLILDEDCSVVDSYKKSYELTRRYKGKLFLFLCLIFLINIVGSMFFIGVFFSVPISILGHVHIYRTLKEYHL